MAARPRATAPPVPEQKTEPIRMTGRVVRPVAASRSRATVGSLRVPLVVGAVHWIIVQVTASLAFHRGTVRDASPPWGELPEPNTGLAHWIVDPLRLWDGLWYRLIAIEGYPPEHSANAAFWPLYPWTMRALSNLTGIAPDLAGYLIANVSFLVALVLLYRLTILDFDERVARVTVWAIALFPTAFFFSAVYTESPFLMLLLGSLYAARRGNWWLAGGIGALAALTRSYGMFLVFPLAVLFLQERGLYLRRLFPAGLLVGLPLLGPALFSLHLNRALGDPWAWRNVQEQWNRFSAAPWDTLRWAFSQSPEGAAIGIRDGADWTWLGDFAADPGWSLLVSPAWRNAAANSDTLELACTLLFMGLALIGIWKLPLYQTVYLLPGLLVPLFQPSSVHLLMSMPRFGLTLFPLFVVIGLLLKGKPWVSIPLAVGSTVLLVVLTIQFATWYWVS